MTTHEEIIIRMRQKYDLAAALIETGTEGWDNYAEWLEGELATAQLKLAAASAAPPAPTPTSPLVTIGNVAFVQFNSCSVNLAHVNHMWIAMDVYPGEHTSDFWKREESERTFNVRLSLAANGEDISFLEVSTNDPGAQWLITTFGLQYPTVPETAE